MMTHVTFLIHKRSKRNVDLMYNSEDGESLTCTWDGGRIET